MVNYKLTYFQARGTAEVIRQLFAISGQEYEDVRINVKEWPKHREAMPFGQMPVLEIDGKQLAQSHAIARYLARKFGYAGKSDYDEALVDSIGDQYKDFSYEIRPYFKVLHGFEKGDVDAATKEVFLPAREKFFTYMTKFLKNNSSGYLVGESVTWADLYLAEIVEYEKKVPQLYEGFPEVKAHSEKVRAIPALKKWIETRPATTF